MPSISTPTPTKSQIRDKEFSQALHGKKATEASGYFAILKKDAAAQKQATSTYFQFWDNKTATNETDEDIKARAANYTDLVNSYYNLATDLYEYGWSQCFHFCRYYKGEGFHQGLARHEHYLAMKLGIQADEVVLDVGCGVGGPAREISAFTNCNIIGLNNNDYQIARATVYADRQGQGDKVTFVKGDFMKMPFPDNTFDRIYSIEATCHAPSLKGVYAEIFRVLKPGGTYATYEWLLENHYDPSNPEHRKISYDIEIGDGLPGMINKNAALQAFEEVGFKVTHDEDLADKGDEIPWYYALDGQFRHVRSLSDLVKVGLIWRPARFVSHGLLGVLEWMRLAPPDAKKTANALGTAANALVAGGKAKLFTPMQFYVAKKPE